MTRNVLLLALLLAAIPADARRAPPAAPPPDPFQQLAADYLDGRSRLDPIAATQLGDHRFDDQITDMSARGRTRRIAFDRDMQARLGTIDRASLPREEQVDAALLGQALAYDVWTVEILQDWAWDPQVYNTAAGNALYLLAARDFAPWDVRLRAATARMRALPGLFAEMRRNLAAPRVPPIHAQTVARQNAGLLDIVDTMLRPHLDALAPVDRKTFEAAAAALKVAVAGQQAWLDGTLVRQARGDFRLGPRLYDRKLAFSLASPLSRAEIKRRATVALAATRAEMYRIAIGLLEFRAAPPIDPTPARQQAMIAAALELSYARRPSRDGLMQATAAALREATGFVRAKGFVALPDAPVAIIAMPKFAQGVTIAYCDAPGPFDRGQRTFFAVSPIPAEWDDAQATSFLREYNDEMIGDLAVHEAMPGHYVQLAHANGGQSPLRAVLQSNSFIEGWAVHAEGMMSDQGFRGSDPLYRLTMLKMRLRSISNALLDIGVHAEGMNQRDAMKLMTVDAFQQEREAAGKWDRVRLTSAQLPTYFIGWSEQEELQRAVMAKEGPAFDLRRYNDAVLSHGSAPVRYVRALMLGEPIS